MVIRITKMYPFVHIICLSQTKFVALDFVSGHKIWVFYILALYRRGVAYKEEGIYDLAKLDFKILLDLDPENKLAKVKSFLI